MQSETYRKLLGKITLSGTLECLTGLHIGASKENMEIGALDSPVVRDPLSLEPYIPGSSLKGKLRALLEKAHPNLSPNRDGGSGTSRHECGGWAAGKSHNKNYQADLTYPGALHCPVCRLFGSTGGGNGENFPARLRVRDLTLTEDSRIKLRDIDTGLLYTEWKFENGIDRVTSAANPRNLERVPKGAEFNFSIVYDVEESESLAEDLQNLQLAIQLLHDDALGGHGSRGYGQVKLKFTRIEARRLEFYLGNSNAIHAVDGIDRVAELVTFFQ